MKRWLFLAVALTAVALLAFIACGGEEEKAATPAATPTAAPPAAATTVHVDLKEWSVTPDVTTVPAGSITFDAKNEGAIGHELVIIKTDLAADALPVSGGRVDEAAAGEEGGEIEEEDLPSGAEYSEATFDLTPGKYVLICNIPGHYENGMFAEVTVQ